MVGVEGFETSMICRPNLEKIVGEIESRASQAESAKAKKCLLFPTLSATLVHAWCSPRIGPH